MNRLLSATKAKFVALAFAIDSATVERPSPNEPPTAFRIWRAGENKFDGGIAIFNEESAKLLEAEQKSRNRPYVFDYSHLSLLSENPEAGKAAGWHSLEVRPDENGKPELWAVACSWVESVAKGMSALVPEWRFFSPAFQVDPQTNVVVGYTNCAITNNPLTHDLPMLASMAVNKELRVCGGARSTPLDPKQALMVLADPNASPEDRQAALECLAAVVDASAQPPVTTSEPPPPAPAPEAEKATAALALSSLALTKRIESLEVRELLHGKVLPPEIKAWAVTQSLGVVKSFLASATNFRPPPAAERQERPSQGDSAGGAGFVAPPVGESPVDKVLGLHVANTGKPGVTAPVNGIRKINHVLPSAIRKGAAQ